MHFAWLNFFSSRPMPEFAPIEIPYTSETVLVSSKSTAILPGADTKIEVVISLLSSLKRPNEYAILITTDDRAGVDEESPAYDRFLSRMRAFTVRAQRYAWSRNKMNAAHDVKLVIPVAVNVDFRTEPGGINIGWLSRGYGVHSGWEGVLRRELVLESVSSKFRDIFHVVLEVSLFRHKHEFIPNGSDPSFGWIWKYEPIIPLPKGTTSVDPHRPSEPPTNSILVLSWNMGGFDIFNGVNDECVLGQARLATQLASFFSTNLTDEISILIVALQESTSLNPRSVVFESDTQGQNWMGFIEAAIPGDGWARVSSVQQVGLTLVVFSRYSKVCITGPVQTSSVRTGNKGLTGNKGCVGLSCELTMDLTTTLLSVINLHLASGDGHAAFRRQELDKIVSSCNFNDTHSFESDLCLVVGDFNSRVAQEVESDGAIIPPEDELLQRFHAEGPASVFNEAPVFFPATYKHVPNSGNSLFDTTRRPAWCDRILCRSTQFFCAKYDSACAIDFSDHTPVFAVFQKKID
jgi:hypothetical protein